MTPDDLEKEAERMFLVFQNDWDIGLVDGDVHGFCESVIPFLRAVHAAAIEKAAAVVENRKHAYRVDVASDIRALKINSDKSSLDGDGK